MKRKHLAYSLVLSLALSNLSFVSNASPILDSINESEVTIESPSNSTEESTTESQTESVTESTTESTTENINESSDINYYHSSRVLDESSKTSGSNITLQVASDSSATPDPDNPGGDPTPDVPPETFSVSVPVEIPISMDLEGQISIPSTLKISNNNDSAIKCVAIDLMLDGSWNAVDFDSFSSNVQSLSTTNDFSIAFRGDKLGSDGLIPVTESSWNFGANDSLSLNTRARLGKQQAGLSADLGTINFTFDWSDKSVSSDDSIGSELPENLTPAGEKYTITFLAPESVTFKGITGSLEVSAGQEVTLPEVEVSNLRQEVANWINADTNEPLTVVNNTITADKAMNISVTLKERAPSAENWFIANGNTLTGLSDEYLNMVDAPTDLVIPNNIGGSSITSIGSGAFANKDLLTSIVVPSTVTEIASDAFSGTGANLKIDISYAYKDSIVGSPFGSNESNVIWSDLHYSWDNRPIKSSELQNMTFNKETGTIVINNNAAYNSTFDIPSSVDGIKVVDIDVTGTYSGAIFTFNLPISIQDTDNLKLGSLLGSLSLNLPEGMTKIPSGFTLSNTQVLNIPNSVKEISANAFANYTKELMIPDTVETIGENAFLNAPNVIYHGSASGSPWGAKNVNMIYIPELSITDDGVVSVKSGISHSSLRGNLVIPESLEGIEVKSIAYEGFKDCSNLTSITIPNTLISIGDYAFYKCYNLESINLPDGITVLGDYVFMNCNKLKEIKLPSNLKSIGMNTFNNCKSLSNITFPSKLESIGDGAFFSSGISNTHLEFPESILTIGESAFAETNIQSVTIPSKVKELNQTFSKCPNLEILNLNEGLLSMNNVFMYSYKVTSIDIPTTVTEFSMGYTYIESLVIPNSVTTLGRLDHNSKLISVTLPNNITNLNQNLFENDISLKEIVVPSSVTGVISYKTFYNCTALEKVDLSNTSITEIYTDAFSECSSLNTVLLPSTLTTIKQNAFVRCEALNGLIIPNSVNVIEKNAFFKIPEVRYSGTATGSPWGALSVVPNN